MLNRIKSVLNNKNVLITGATGGIGFEIAKNFNSFDSNIFLVGRNIDKLRNYYIHRIYSLQKHLEKFL